MKMKPKIKTHQKIISALIVVLILFPNFIFFIPEKANAQFVVDCITHGPTGIEPCAGNVAATATAKASWISKVLNGTTAAKTTISASTDLKQWAKVVLEEALRALAKKFLQKITESTVNWINAGFHGAPLFLERPGSFFKDIAKSEIKKLVNSIGYDNAKFPFGKNFLMSAISGYKATFEQNAQYSLSRVTRDEAFLQGVRDDFGVGGWDAFLINTQFPQNNYFGAQIMYTDHLAEKLKGTTENEADMIKTALAQGQGFLSPQKCETNPNFNKFKNQFQQPTFKPTTRPPTLENCAILDADGGIDRVEQQLCMQRNGQAQENYRLDLSSEKLLWDETNSCPNRPNGTSGFVRTTPGSVVADQIMTATSSVFRQGELGIAMGNSLSAIFDALLNQLFEKGLSALQSKKNEDNRAPTEQDNFDYYGNNFGPSSNTGAVNEFQWKPEPDFNLETEIQKYKTNGSEYIDWVDPNTDPSVINDFNNQLNPPATCPAGTTGTPPDCIPQDDEFLGPPEEAPN